MTKNTEKENIITYTLNTNDEFNTDQKFSFDCKDGKVIIYLIKNDESIPVGELQLNTSFIGSKRNGLYLEFNDIANKDNVLPFTRIDVN